MFTIYDAISALKYHLRIDSESKAKNKIDNQNQGHFNMIINLNLRIITPLYTRDTELTHTGNIGYEWNEFNFVSIHYRVSTQQRFGKKCVFCNMNDQRRNIFDN